MKTGQIAVQCYTLREHLRTAEDFATSMRRVRTIGYRAVQISGVGPIPARDIRRMTDAEGLRVCATHEPALDILERPEAVVDRLGALGCTLTGLPDAPCRAQLTFRRAAFGGRAEPRRGRVEGRRNDPHVSQSRPRIPQVRGTNAPGNPVSAH